MAGLKAISPLQLDDPRRATITVHRYLRELIFSCDLPAGLTFSQVELAGILGVSRTPLREALRMLQEEGLIEAEANRRCRVAGLSPYDIDCICGSRILLESLAMRISLPQLTPEEIDALDGQHVRMEELEATARLDGSGPSDDWRHTHRGFHAAMLCKAPPALLDQIDTLAERSERYFLAVVLGRPFGSIAKRGEHREIAGHIRAGAFSAAIMANAHHRARTALAMLMEIAVDFEPVAVRAALKLLAADAEVPASKPALSHAQAA